MIKFFIFDLDGTLYEKKSIVLHYLKEFAKIEGHDFNKIHQQFTNSYLLTKKETFSSPGEFWSRVHDNFVRVIRSDKKELLDELAERAKKEVFVDIAPRSHLIELFSRIKKSGGKIIVFTGSDDMYSSIRLIDLKNETNKLKIFKQSQIDTLGLTNYVDRLILTTQYGGYKPQRFVFEKLLEDIGAKPEECVMIGDTSNDLGATQLGIFSVLIGESHHEEFTPQLRIQNFKELIDIIDFDKCILKSHLTEQDS